MPRFRWLNLIGQTRGLERKAESSRILELLCLTSHNLSLSDDWLPLTLTRTQFPVENTEALELGTALSASAPTGQFPASSRTRAHYLRHGQQTRQDAKPNQLPNASHPQRRPANDGTNARF
jgi:hypothetical protein